MQFESSIVIIIFVYGIHSDQNHVFSHLSGKLLIPIVDPVGIQTSLQYTGRLAAVEFEYAVLVMVVMVASYSSNDAFVAFVIESLVEAIHLASPTAIFGDHLVGFASEVPSSVFMIVAVLRCNIVNGLSWKSNLFYSII